MYEDIDIMLYNAMSFEKVKHFSKRLLKDLNNKINGCNDDSEEIISKYKKKSKVANDMEDLSNIIVEKLRY